MISILFILVICAFLFFEGMFIGKTIILGEIAEDIQEQIYCRDSLGYTTLLNEQYIQKKIYMYNYVKDRTLVWKKY